ncbi:unnamed protein product [Calypogeia fissa]
MEERGRPLVRRHSTQSLRSQQSESKTEPQFLENPEDLDVPCTTDCPRSESYSPDRYGKSERSSSSPDGIRALYQIGKGPELQNSSRASQPLSSRPGSRSPLRPNVTSQRGRSSTTPSSTSDNGKTYSRDSAERTAPSSIPHPSSVHYSPETCDPDIAESIYLQSSGTEQRAWRRRKVPKFHFPCFGRRKKKPEYWIEKNKGDYSSMTAEEQERLRKENEWKKIQQGRHGKSMVEQQFEWEQGLRQYDSCSNWQRDIGEDARKRHQDNLIMAAVRKKPISKIQDLRTELFQTDERLDQKTHQVADVCSYRRKSQRGRDREALLAQNPPQQGRRFSMTKPWFNQLALRSSSQESVPATPCNCRAKEIKPMRQSSQNDIRNRSPQNDLKGRSASQENLKEDAWKRLYTPKLKKIRPFFSDKRMAVGWNDKWPPQGPQASDDDDQGMGKRPQQRSQTLNKWRGQPTKAQILRDAQLDADEWSVIDLDSPKSANRTNCFGCYPLSN